MARWRFEFIAGDLRGLAQLDWWPERKLAAYRAELFGAAQGVIVVANDAIAARSLNRSLEIRAPGLWAQHVRESGERRWTVGLEAMALLVDNPLDERGEPTALGYDLEWDGDQVFGEVLLDEQRWQIDGTGVSETP